MGTLSDLFSGKKHKEALDHLKNKAALLTVAGATLFVTAGASRSGGYSDVREPVKKEAVQKKDLPQTRTDSVVAKFNDYRLKHAAERMMKTPTGSAVLKELTKKEIPVEVTSEISPDLGGAYYPDMKKILINPECSDDLIASILVHEGSHALQAANGCRLGPHLNAQSYFTMNKAMEADAMKNQLFAAAELKSAGDASVYDAFAREHGKLVKSYEGFCKQFGEQRDSVAKHTMLAYYNNRAYIKTYENRYVDALNTFFKAGKKRKTARSGCSISTIPPRKSSTASAGWTANAIWPPRIRFFCKTARATMCRKAPITVWKSCRKNTRKPCRPPPPLQSPTRRIKNFMSSI